MWMKPMNILIWPRPFPRLSTVTAPPADEELRPTHKSTGLVSWVCDITDPESFVYLLRWIFFKSQMKSFII